MEKQPARKNQRLALLAGSPGPGLLGIAARLAGDGVGVVLAHPPGNAGGADSGACRSIRLDFGDRAAWVAAMRALDQGSARLAILVNCLGTTEPGTVESVGEQAWDEAMERNVEAFAYSCRAALQCFGATGGAIVNVCSVGGLVAGADSFLPDVAGGAIRLLTKSVALYCLDRGYPVACNCVQSVTHPSTGADYPSAAAALARGPHGAPAAADTAAMVSFLAGLTGCGITGAEFIVDGGRTAR